MINLFFFFILGCPKKHSKMSPYPHPGCPFCHESIHSSVFYETRDFIALYNIAPILPGHSLVIPRAHHTSLLALSDESLFDFFKTARIALLILMKAFHTNAFDWSIQEKPEAGQTIEHLHLHIVPRIREDLIHPGHWYPLIHRNDMEIMDSENRPRLAAKELQVIIEKLKEAGRQLTL
jgi:bis(5'-adenosyl)-triphosphatase